MSDLQAKLARLIARQGPIRFADYIAACIETYYAGRDPLGAEGDFTTAPEISQMFGELIGLWMVDSWHKCGRPAPFNLVELGPGRGNLMADALRAARLDPAFMAAARIYLIERSATLADMQRRKIPDAVITRDLHRVPDAPALFIANEFFDCLPVRQLEMTGAGWRERHVTFDPEQKCFALIVPPDAPPADHLVPLPFRDAVVGSVFETCPQATALAEDLALRIADHGGAALIIDYGKPKSGYGAGVQALKDHRRHNVLDLPGEADVTAHVDFEAIADAARRHAMVFGPISQARFLSGIGLSARAAALTAARPQSADEIAAAVHRLTAGDQMGELFQVICLAKMPDGTFPAGFDPPMTDTL